MNKPNWELLQAITEFSDRAFDPYAKNKLKILIENKHRNETIKYNLLEIIDLCIHGSLCSGTILQAMQMEYRKLGGINNPPMSKTPWRNII